MGVVFVGELGLAEINTGLDAMLTASTPLLASVDLLLAGSFGLGPLLADLSLQLSAALSFSLSLALSVSNPLEDLEAQLVAVISLVAAISASLALGLPQVSVELTASITATAAIAAALGAQVGGISALIEATLSVKLPVVSLVASFSAALSAEVALLSIGFDAPTTLAASGSLYNALAASGVGAIAPGDQVWGVILLASSSASRDALTTIMLTS